MGGQGSNVIIHYKVMVHPKDFETAQQHVHPVDARRERSALAHGVEADDAVVAAAKLGEVVNLLKDGVVVYVEKRGRLHGMRAARRLTGAGVVQGGT